MFTGIIEELGLVESFAPGTAKDGGARLVIRAKKALAPEDRLTLGESIAVNGCCLTALDINDQNCNITSFNAFYGTKRAVKFDALFHSAFAAQSGGINQQ